MPGPGGGCILATNSGPPLQKTLAALGSHFPTPNFFPRHLPQNQLSDGPDTCGRALTASSGEKFKDKGDL